jgi:NADPH2:quinone reductase
LAALTAWQGLFEFGQLQPDHKILIHAGAGGVGHLAVQFARAHGAHVIATASAGNADFLAALGAHEIIDYRRDDFVEACYGLDVVLDLVGGDVGQRSLHTLSERGVLVTVPTATADPIVTAAEDMGLHAHGMTVRPDAFHLDEISELIEDGDVRLHVAQTYPLSEAAAAQQALEKGHGRGKLVLACG